MGERVLDGAERMTAGGAIVRDKTRKRACPAAALRRKPRAIDLQEAAVNTASAFRHRPVRESLIEIAGEKADERWMDPRIGIEAVRREHAVTMPDGGGGPA